MACNATDIPTLSFPRDEIIKIVPASYDNKAKRIKIQDLPPDMIPGSPEDIRIPVPASGTMTPVNIGDPRSGTLSPVEGARSPKKARSPERGQGTHLLVERALRGK